MHQPTRPPIDMTRHPEPTKRRLPSLRAHLVGLVLVVLVPALAIGGASAWRLAESYREAFRDRLSDTTRALALAADSELGRHLATLRAIASSPLLHSPDRTAFHAWAAELAHSSGGWVVLCSLAPDYPQLLNTRLPPGQDPGVSCPAAAISRLNEAEGPVVTDLFTAPHTGNPIVLALSAVKRGDGPNRLAVGLAIPPAVLSRALAPRGLAGGATATLVDSQGMIVARSGEHERYLGRPLPDWFGGAIMEQSQGLTVRRGLNGEEMLFAFARLANAPDWHVAVGEPWAVYRSTWTEPLLALAVGGFAALALGFALATALGRRLLRPIEALVRHAETVVGRRPAGVPGGADTPAKVAEFEALRLAVRQAEAELREREADFHAAFEQSPIPMTQSDPATGDYLRVNDAFCELVGRKREEILGHSTRTFTHPDDRKEDLAGWLRMISGGSPFHQVEKRYLRPDGSVRWVWLLVSPVRDAAGRIVRTLAVGQDVTERREAAERQILLMRELDHRAKNALAVVQATLRLTPKEDAKTYAKAVEGRVAALARAHTLLAAGSWSGAALGSVVEGELAPFRPQASAEAPAPRVTMEGPKVLLSPNAAQAFSMALHELATNAVKHGALSVPGGHVRVDWGVDRMAGLLRLCWTETGGPPLRGAPQRRGFGSRVLQATISDQLGGRVAQDWRPEGLVCHLDVPLSRVLARPDAAVMTAPAASSP